MNNIDEKNAQIDFTNDEDMEELLSEEEYIKYIDAKFEKMSRECADSMNGTHPPIEEEPSPRDYGRWDKTCIEVISRPTDKEETESK
jgi:hypothetical protein